MPVVIGIDPSLTGTGVCVIDTADADPIACAGLTLESSKPVGDDVHARLDRIMGMQAVMPAPDGVALVVIEAPAYSRGASPGTWDRAGLWWIIVARYLVGFAVPVLTVPPGVRAKYATGRGNAGKGAVIDAVSRRYPGAATGGDDNLADALILAAIGARMLGHPVDSPPATHLAALDKLRLPSRVVA